MKTLHPIHYTTVEVSCRCGNTFTTRSVSGKAIRMEICSHCHPFYTGKLKTMESTPRVQQFRLKYGR